MKSRPLGVQSVLATDHNTRRDDARGGSFLLAHQQLGALALGTTPTNGQTVTVIVNSTSVVFNAVTGTPTNPGDVKAPGTALGFVTNLIAALRRPDLATSTYVPVSTANQPLIQYVGWAWPGSSTTIVPFSFDKNVNGASSSLTSLNITTTVTSGTWTAQTMQLYVEDGTYYVGGTRVLFTGASTPTFTAPVSHPRIDLVTADSSGNIVIVGGTENASPVAPTYPLDKIVICEVYHVVGETALYDSENQQSGQGYVYNDVRRILVQGKYISATASEISAADSGSANAYALTLNPVPASLTTGMIVQVLNIANASTGSSTLNVNGLGAKTIKKGGTLNLASGDLAAGMNALFSYDGTNWQLLSPTANITFLGLFANGVSTTKSSAGSQTIAHGLGTAPRMVRIHAISGQEVWSHGSYNGTQAAYVASGVVSGGGNGVLSGTGTIIAIQVSFSGGIGSNGCYASITVDATNINLTWTAGTSSYAGGSTPFEWEAEA